MSEHTKTPPRKHVWSSVQGALYRDGSKKEIALVMNQKSIDAAEVVANDMVRKLNAHDDLVAACEAAAGRCQCSGTGRIELAWDEAHFRRREVVECRLGLCLKVRAALAKARS